MNDIPVLRKIGETYLLYVPPAPRTKNQEIFVNLSHVISISVEERGDEKTLSIKMTQPHLPVVIVPEFFTAVMEILGGSL